GDTGSARAAGLDEAGHPQRAARAPLPRHRRGKRPAGRAEAERRLCELLVAGVRPAVPQVVNSIGMRLALIPPGRFRMGAPKGENERGGNEEAHEVEITRPFYLGVFPVTQGQWLRVRGTNPSYFCATGAEGDRFLTPLLDD